MHSLATEEACVEKRIRTQRLRFRIIFSVAVLLVSFLYGVVSGLRNPPSSAEASFFPLSETESEGAEEYIRKLYLAPGLTVFPIGEDAKINGTEAMMGAFVSNRPIKKLLAEQVEIWEGRGFFTVGVATSSKGTAFALDKDTGLRYTMTAWGSLSPFSGMLPEGFAVQGTVASLSAGENRNASAGRRGELPGVPIRPGGTAGTIFSSRESGGRSYTGVYTNPDALKINLAFYRDYLLKGGWVPSMSEQRVVPWGAMLAFEKAGRELVMIFTEKSVPSAGGEQKITTLVLSSHSVEPRI